ncbi:hypothetical protein H6F51_10530 [Cyanobacteria bacterium FACHB-DQ100]|nr:hypothetical protein [Cyanobacteria bacterium FACHB-DQ100]
MRKGNLLICLICGVTLLAEWSVPGQLLFGFPFLTEPWQNLAKVPASASKVRDQTFAELDKRRPAMPSDPMLTPAAPKPALDKTTLDQLRGTDAHPRLPAKSTQ